MSVSSSVNPAAIATPTPWVYFHTHWDREWYEPFRTYQLRLSGVIDAVLDQLEAGVMDCFTLDGQTVLLDDCLALCPQQEPRLRAAIAQGKMVLGPWYVMPDELLVCGEALLRNLRWGIQASRQWGCHQFTGYLPDTFGHSAHMPMLLQLCGIESAVVWRGVTPAQNMFWWQSPDGSRVLTAHLSEGYFLWPFQDPDLVTPAEQDAALKKLAATLPDKNPPGQPGFLLPLGGDHLGPLPEAAVKRLTHLLPHRVISTPDRFMAAMHSHYSASAEAASLQTIAGELTDCRGQFLLPGVYSSRTPLKQAQRRMEHRLLKETEPLLALTRWQTGMNNATANNALHAAWRLLLLNTPHDSICGCSVDAVHRENLCRYDEIEDITTALAHRARHSLLGRVKAPMIVNLGSQPYTGVVTFLQAGDPSPVQPDQIAEIRTTLIRHDRTSHQIVPLAHRTQTETTGWLWVENVPPYASVPLASVLQPVSHPVRAEQHSTVRQKTLTLCNQHVQLTVTVPTGKAAMAGGTVTFHDLKNNRTLPYTHRILDFPEQGDSYNRAPVPGSTPAEYRLCAASLIHAGPLVAQCELIYSRTGKANAHQTFTTRMTIKADCEWIECESEWVNHHENHALQVVFPTGAPLATILAEGHFGVVERQYDPDYRVTNAMPAERWQELKSNTGPIQRFVSGNQQAWLTAGLCEYEVMGDHLHLTLMRAFGQLSGDTTGVRGAQAGPPLPTPEAQYLESALTARYAWLPQPDATHQLYEAADAFYGLVATLSPTMVSALSGSGDTALLSESLFAWPQRELVTSALISESGGYTLRLMNTADRAITLTLTTGFTWRQAQRVNALNEPFTPSQNTLQATPAERQLQLLFAPLAVQTLFFSVE